MIDISAWKEFRVGNYFHGIRGTSRKMQELDDGLTPIIAAARYNQGIAGYYNVPSEYENAITISCNGVGCGSTYYHDYPFAITGDAIVLENIGKVPQGALHFIASVYDAYFSRKYSYADKCSADKAEAELIALPATSDGQPDWDYMESYMKAVMEESEKALSNLKQADDTKHLIDVSGWGEFRVGDLFEKLQAPCNNKKAKREIISEISDESHTLPLVYAVKRNNGIIYWGNEKDFTAYSNVISIIYNGAVAAGTVYAQEQKTGILAESYFIRLKNNPDISFYVNLYLSRIIENVIYDKYTRDDLAVWDDKVENCYIKLPIASTGEPDWQYMEDYMKNIMNKQEMAADNLSKIA